MTVFPFVPPPLTAFQFQPTLDGTTYLAQVRWNLFGQRWYLHLSDTSGNRLLTTPMIGSPDPIATSSLAWDGTRQIVVAVTATAHGLPIGSEALMTVKGATPAAFNGLFICAAKDSMTLTYRQTVDPGEASVQATVGTDIDLLQGLFASTLVYRESAIQFEVMP